MSITKSDNIIALLGQTFSKSWKHLTINKTSGQPGSGIIYIAIPNDTITIHYKPIGVHEYQVTRGGSGKCTYCTSGTSYCHIDRNSKSSCSSLSNSINCIIDRRGRTHMITNNNFITSEQIVIGKCSNRCGIGNTGGIKCSSISPDKGFLMGSK